jgi:Holin of 3TMs, for gene-transfer release
MDPITAVSSLLNTILGRVLPDPTAQAAAKAQMAQMVMNGEMQQLTAQAGVITAEASSANKLASSWRPILMYCFMAIIVNNYILEPYLNLFFGVHVSLTIPPDMWALLKLGVGGYVAGRTVEKITTPHPITGQAPLATAASAVANVFRGQ